jgi:hypothetical protein
MIGWNNAKTITVARVLLVLTVLLLAVSLSFLLFQWNLVHGYSVELSVFPLLFEYTPLGLVFLNNIVYLSNPPFKLLMDLLFLVPYTLAILVTGPITVFSYPLNKIAGCEKFGEAKNRVRSLITRDVKREKRGVYGAVLIIIIIIISYAVQLLTYFIGYTSMPAGELLYLSYPYVYGIAGLVFAYSIMENVTRKSLQKAEHKQKTEVL